MRREARGDAIRRVGYANPQSPGSPIEVLALSELRQKAPPGYLAEPQRPAFHQLHVLTGGQCAIEIDFARVDLRRGVVAWLRPGQVLRFDLHAGVVGWLVLFTPDVLAPGLAEAPGAPRVDLGSTFAEVAWLLERLRLASAEPPTPDRTALLGHLLHALLYLVRRREPPHDPGAAPEGVFAMFRREVERRFATTRQLEDYERLVGYSAKTLTRATRAATGRSAKAYIDQRVLLEGQRLLAHSRLTTAEIAARLGFTEATNFVKFFRRTSGESPAEFRTAMALRSGGPAGRRTHDRNRSGPATRDG